MTDHDQMPLSRIYRTERGAGTALRELRSYRDLLRFLVWRSVKVRYAQSILGFGWAIAQPLAQVLVFTIVFGRLVGVDSGGENYALFAFVALVPWSYFSNALTQATASLSSNANLLKKVYFPRLILPLAQTGARLVDFAIAFLLLAAALLIAGEAPGEWIILLPLLILIMVITALGAGLWLSALAIQYRDINHAAGFAVQLMMYASPVVYSIDLVPGRWQHLYALNPMVGVIEGFRSALLDSGPPRFDLIGIGAGVAVLLLASGLAYFQSREHLFADVG